MSSSHQRYPQIDIWRYVAALAVVWIHSSDSTQGQSLVHISRIAVPLFVTAMIALGIESPNLPQNFNQYLSFAGLRFRRLYVPFLIWSIFYLFVRIAKHACTHTGSPILLGWSTFLTGTAHHLWFLPFAFALSLLVPLAAPLHKLVQDRHRAIGMTILILIGLAISSIPFPLEFDAAESPTLYFLAMSWCAVGSVFFGLAAALVVKPSQALQYLALASAALVAVLISVPVPILSLPCLGGFLLFLAARYWLSPTPQKAQQLFSFLGSLSYGVYLFHVLLVEGVQLGLSRYLPVPTLTGDTAVWTISAVGSTVIVAMARRSNRLRTIFP